MGEKYYGWDEISDALILLGIQKADDEQIKGHRKKVTLVKTSKIYCPHAYLILNFHETLNQNQKIKFRKHYLRKVSPDKPDVIILQDIKDLVMFLLITPVSPQFVNFFHLPVVDRFLRALIIYFQYYVKTWEELMQERAATMKKAPNPLAHGNRSRYADEMQSLRCMLGREYADLIVGCHDTTQYHHMTGGKKGSSTMTQSQGEKDLRIFEVLIYVAHRVVWIALQRKYFSLIEVELHRLLRTEAYNTPERLGSRIVQDMLEDDIRVLHGYKVHIRRKLLRNSPLIQQLIYCDCDYRLLSLGMANDDTHDPQIIYLKSALLVEEEKLSKLGIKVGILGHKRADYDVMLIPNEEEKFEESTDTQMFEKTGYEKQSSFSGPVVLNSPKQEDGEVTTMKRLPLRKSNFSLTPQFPMKIVDIAPRGCEGIREEARRKWLIREIKRHNRKHLDTYSTVTTLD